MQQHQGKNSFNLRQLSIVSVELQFFDLRICNLTEGFDFYLDFSKRKKNKFQSDRSQELQNKVEGSQNNLIPLCHQSKGKLSSRNIKISLKDMENEKVQAFLVIIENETAQTLQQYNFNLRKAIMSKSCKNLTEFQFQSINSKDCLSSLKLKLSEANRQNLAQTHLNVLQTQASQAFSVVSNLSFVSTEQSTLRTRRNKENQTQSSRFNRSKLNKTKKTFVQSCQLQKKQKRIQQEELLSQKSTSLISSDSLEMEDSKLYKKTDKIVCSIKRLSSFENETDKMDHASNYQIYKFSEILKTTVIVIQLLVVLSLM